MGRWRWRRQQRQRQRQRRWAAAGGGTGPGRRAIPEPGTGQEASATAGRAGPRPGDGAGRAARAVGAGGGSTSAARRGSSWVPAQMRPRRGEVRQGREQKKKVGEAEVGRGLDGCAEKGFDGRQVQKELVQVGLFSFWENAATVTGTRVGRPREGVRQIPSGLAFCDVSQRGRHFFSRNFPPLMDVPNEVFWEPPHPYPYILRAASTPRSMYFACRRIHPLKVHLVALCAYVINSNTIIIIITVNLHL